MKELNDWPFSWMEKEQTDMIEIAPRRHILLVTNSLVPMIKTGLQPRIELRAYFDRFGTSRGNTLRWVRVS